MKELKTEQNKTIGQLAEENPDKTYTELTKIQEASKAIAEGICITGALKKDLQPNRSLTDTMDEKAYYELRADRDKLKKRVAELDNSLSIALEQNDKYQREIKNLKWVKEQDYIFLVDENKHLHEEIREIKNDNRKLSLQIEDKVNQVRKAGL